MPRSALKRPFFPTPHAEEGAPAPVSKHGPPGVAPSGRPFETPPAAAPQGEGACWRKAPAPPPPHAEECARAPVLPPLMLRRARQRPSRSMGREAPRPPADPSRRRLRRLLRVRTRVGGRRQRRRPLMPRSAHERPFYPPSCRGVRTSARSSPPLMLRRARQRPSRSMGRQAPRPPAAPSRRRLRRLLRVRTRIGGRRQRRRPLMPRSAHERPFYPPSC